MEALFDPCGPKRRVIPVFNRLSVRVNEAKSTELPRMYRKKEKLGSLSDWKKTEELKSISCNETDFDQKAFVDMELL